MTNMEDRCCLNYSFGFREQFVHGNKEKVEGGIILDLYLSMDGRLSYG